MKRFIIISLLATAAWAGSRAADTDGSPPTSATAGVNIAEVEACRGSVRFTDGGTIMGGKLVPYYYDSVLGWTEAKTADQCTLATDTLIDGGSRRTQTCEFAVQARYGRAALAGKSLVGEDGGAVQGTVRLECWGRELP